MTTDQQEQAERQRERTLEGTQPWTDDDDGNESNASVAAVPPRREPRCVDGELLDA